MINKEEREKAKEFLKQEIINSYSEKKAEMLDTIRKYISELEEENKRLEEINKEHQKLNGELQKKLTRAEEIIKGKCIQELGLSDLYKED